ncbi:unnamed protein product [Cylicocyclus nassatus]|uniref:SCP domain-containing protein n=1 Tax=Cylicocyclus nassatus TaxID=53992 RepID=A0AA36GPM2_CYLNA|nr:unnamed protein product [Cylicocyclus nassatus]
MRQSYAVICFIALLALPYVAAQEDTTSSLDTCATEEEESSAAPTKAPSTVPPAENQICSMNAGWDPVRTKALDMTNWRRSQLALGQVDKANSVYMPQAANMQKLRYDCELEKSAIARAKACPEDQYVSVDVQENKNKIAKSAVADQVQAMSESVKTWWKVIRNDPNNIGLQVFWRQKFESSTLPSFSRMAWALSNKMGCAVESCGSDWQAVCHYAPGGNKIEERIYLPGTTCTQCPAGTHCDSSLGLCV